MKKVMIWLLSIIGLYFISFSLKVNAYTRMCDGERLHSNNQQYYVCDDNVYLYKSDTPNSSYMVGDIKQKYRNGKILYVGKVNGVDTFYSTGFNYYSIVRDYSFSENDLYSDISINGIVVYSGAFKENYLIDQSNEMFLPFYNEVGTYVIRQFAGGKIVNVINVFVVSKKDTDLNVLSVTYNDTNIENKSLVYDSRANITIDFGGGKYGFANKVDVKINSCEFKKIFSKKMVISQGEILGCLDSMGYNSLSFTVYDGLERSETFYYKFNLNNKNVSISLENSVSKVVTTSRRIVIDAMAGLGNTLVSENCLYYWSKSANDRLTYEDFMKNYEISENRGSYYSNKAVILRDREGVYYLYVLATDSGGGVSVVRSDEYVLKKNRLINKFTVFDTIIVVIFCVGAIAPIAAYLVIRGKDTD